MWGLDTKPKNTESALHKREKLHNRLGNIWSNKPVIDAFQTMGEFSSEKDHGTMTKESLDHFSGRGLDAVSASPSGYRVLFGKLCPILQLMGNKLSGHVVP